MTYSNKITSMCFMALVLIMGYSLSGMSGMNLQDRMAYAGKSDIIVLDNQSNQKFTPQKETKNHFNIKSTVPGTIEPGKSYTIKGDPSNLEHTGIVHLYYTYGKNYTAEFTSEFSPPFNTPHECSHKSGSSEISIGCSKEKGNEIKFTIKDAN
ncbi:MAG: hypothetical protein ACPKPY_05685 [Nitrososphaeraceae archaeon]